MSYSIMVVVADKETQTKLLEVLTKELKPFRELSETEKEWDDNAIPTIRPAYRPNNRDTLVVGFDYHYSDESTEYLFAVCTLAALILQKENPYILYDGNEHWNIVHKREDGSIGTQYTVRDKFGMSLSPRIKKDMDRYPRVREEMEKLREVLENEIT